MYIATKDFSHLGIEVKAGQEVSPADFEPDDLAGLVAKGLLVSPDVPELDEVEEAAAPKKAARRKSK